MTTWLIHGFNITDGGAGTVGKLKPHLPHPAIGYNYGWTGLAGLSCANRRAVKGLLMRVRPGDSLAAHSNGCLIAWQVAQVMGSRLSSVVCINPALRRDARWPKGLPVLCLANSRDWVVQLGRVWGRLTELDGVQAQGWGAAGRYGFTGHQSSVDNIDTAMAWWGKPVLGHSGVFDEAEHWGRIIATWMKSI